MIEYRLLKEFPPEIIRGTAALFVEAGWMTDDDSDSFLLPALRGSAAVAAAFDDDKLIGIARALSDGCSDAYIQDVAVSYGCRRKGVGRQLIELLLSELRRRGVDWIALVGEPGTERFYSALGWQKQDKYSFWRAPGE